MGKLQRVFFNNVNLPPLENSLYLDFHSVNLFRNLSATVPKPLCSYKWHLKEEQDKKEDNQHHTEEMSQT